MFDDPQNHYYTPSGLFTFSVFSILLNHEVARTKRYPTPISLMFLSICTPAPLIETIRLSLDQNVAQALKTKLRQTDISAQYGEDFLILLTNTDASGANIAARRLVDHLNSVPLTLLDKPVQSTCYAGLVSHPGGPNISPDTLMKLAEQAHQEARLKDPGTIISI